MRRLVPAVRSYPWGSKTLIATLRGDSVPSPVKEAELWYGAHPQAPSTVDDQPLTDVIAADQLGQLSPAVQKRFDGQLPFLLKLLAADEPLSLQAHPTKKQAVIGCAAEDEQGIARNAADRNYRDDNHKPETIVALTKFEAFVGFRPLTRTRELLHALHCPELEKYVGMLDNTADPSIDDASLVRALFTTWITIPKTARITLIDAVVAACQRLCAAEDEQTPEWMQDVACTLLSVHNRYPTDVGVLGALLLNKVTLAPGDALYLGAGQLHAYIHGLGVEIMANSDNVLRGGLTSKHVDVPELVKVLDFTPLDDPFVKPEPYGQGTHYPVPVEEFALDAYTVEPGTRIDCDRDGPAVVLCTRGEVTVSQTADQSAQHKPVVCELTPTQAVWVSHEDGRFTLEGNGDVFIASCPIARDE